MIPVKDYILVFIQICLFGLFAFLNGSFPLINNLVFKYLGYPLATIGLIAILFAFIQLNTYLSPYPSPKKSAVLVTSGIFGIVRHPIYSGIIALMLGLSFVLADGFKLATSIITLFFFWYKSNYEEGLLSLVFPDYMPYKKSVGRFFPKLRRLIP